jgi:GNAT superfamily N-acetyltransferase
MIAMREATAADRDAILALRRRAFADVDREKQEPAFWEWEFAEGRMFIAEEDRRVVGHFGFVPRRFYVVERNVRALLGVDAMVDPHFRRHGIFTRLATFAAEGVRNDVPLLIAWQIRPAVLEGMLRAGWKSILSAPVLLRPTLASIPLPAVRSSPTAQEIVDRGRFDASPIWRYTRRANDAAHLVSRDSVLKGINTHCLIDFAGDPRALRPLIREAIADARSRGVHLAAALVSRDHPHYATLLRCGFIPGPHRFRFLAQSFDPKLDLDQRWALTWASTDHV